MPKPFHDLAPLSLLKTRRRSACVFQTAFPAVSFAAALLLSGCGTGAMSPGVNVANAVKVNGKVHGGQQPVSGSLIQLWSAGTSGNGSSATQLLTSAVYTDGGGGFDITGDYTCPSATAQVYITATGGNPGLYGTVDNGALALVAALGDCGSLASVPTISISEVTTVAAAYALAPFAAGVDQVGASSTNLAGLRSAMQTAMMLASSYTGAAPAPTLPAGATTETAKLLSLANVIANCVNSSGGTECSSLESDATVATYPVPADTFQVALTVAQHPGNNITAIFNDAPPQAAFGGALTSAPNDWSMSIAYTGGGLGQPNSVSVDAANNVWVSNLYGGVSGFTAQGTPLFVSGVTSGMGQSTSVTIDASGSLWVANGAYDLDHPNGSIAQVTAGGTVLSGTQGYTAGNLDLPDSIAALPDGSMVVVSSGNSLMTVLSANGSVLSGSGYGLGLLQNPSAVAVDSASNLWIVNRDSGALVEMDSSGNLLLQSPCCGSPDSIAIDTNSTLWIGDSSAGTVTEVRSDGVVLATIGGSAPASPRAITIDGGGHLFIADAANGIVAELHDSSYGSAGSVVGDTPNLGMDAHLSAPKGIAADASGNLWVTSSGDNRLVSFVGMTTPVATPRIGLPALP